MQIHLIEIGSAEYKQMADLRIKVLLEPIGIPASYIDPVREKDDLLIGAFDGQQLVGCCILTSLDDNTIQLRQMAVDTATQKSGVGRSIIDFAENIARTKGFRLLMMHARDTVIPFYEKCGYHIAGEAFSEVGIGHHRMEKSLL